MTRGNLAFGVCSGSSKLNLLEHTLQAFPSLLTVFLEISFEIYPDAFEGIIDGQFADCVGVEKCLE